VPDKPHRDDQEAARLLREVQAGAPGAWDALVGHYERLVLAVPRQMGLSDADAEEVFQATWLALFEQIALIRQPGALGSWIITTAQRQCWRVQRRAQRRREQTGLESQAAELPAGGPAPAELAERLERQALVRDALAELRPRCRDLLVRLFLEAGERGGSEASSYAEIARELRMPVGSIGPTRGRCLQELARLLEGRLGP
jgi:RNA polymerase sigma factor (sigma-70 family)